jgi:hypothetical protein
MGTAIALRLIGLVPHNQPQNELNQERKHRDYQESSAAGEEPSAQQLPTCSDLLRDHLDRAKYHVTKIRNRTKVTLTATTNWSAVILAFNPQRRQRLDPCVCVQYESSILDSSDESSVIISFYEMLGGCLGVTLCVRRLNRGRPSILSEGPIYLREARRRHEPSFLSQSFVTNT